MEIPINISDSDKDAMLADWTRRINNNPLFLNELNLKGYWLTELKRYLDRKISDGWGEKYEYVLNELNLWRQNIIDKLEDDLITEKMNDLRAKVDKIRSKKIAKLKHNQIALTFALNDVTITRDNADRIALDHGWTSKDSGEALYQSFTTYRDKRRRIRTESTAQKLRNKIELFESVIPFLNKDGYDRAMDEIGILKSLEKQYNKKK